LKNDKDFASDGGGGGPGGGGGGGGPPIIGGGGGIDTSLDSPDAMERILDDISTSTLYSPAFEDDRMVSHFCTH